MTYLTSVDAPDDVQEFTATTGTWTKPANALICRVTCIGPGGAGGSGYKGAGDRYGGGGGGHGGISIGWFLAEDLPATVSVSVPTAGVGGAAQTANSTNGLVGENIGSTAASSFGTLLRAVCGGYGGRGEASQTGNPGSGNKGTAVYGAGAAYSSTSGTWEIGGTNYAVAGSKVVSGVESVYNQSQTNTYMFYAGVPKRPAGGRLGQAGQAGTAFGQGGSGGGPGTNDGVDSGAGGNGGPGVVIVETWKTGSADVQWFESSGTWTKPTGNYAYTFVAAVGAGGGGGSGRRGAAGTDRYGGVGGAGGSVNIAQYLFSDMASTVAVTVGAAGAGGAGQTADDTNGVTGDNGGTTIVEGYLRASGGFGGYGGTNASQGGRSAVESSPSIITNSANGNQSSSSNPNSGWVSGAPGGARLNTSNSAQAGSQAGQNALLDNIQQEGGTSSGGNGHTYTGLPRGLFFHPTGTGGGVNAGGTVSGSGGAGTGGSGGAGGAGSANGTTSGAGGNGGGGYVLAVSFGRASTARDRRYGILGR